MSGALTTAFGQTTKSVTCHGVSDAAAIQAVINSSVAGDTIEFGSAQVCSVSNIGSNAALVFPGSRTYHGSGTVIRLVGTSTGYPIASLPNGNASNTNLNGLIFDSGGLTSASLHIATLGGSSTTPTTNVSIQGCSFRNSATNQAPAQGSGIYSSIPITNSTISGNTFVNLSSGITISNFGSGTISNNVFTTITSGDAIYLPEYSSESGLNITGNTGTGLTRMGIEIQAQVAGIQIDNVLIQSNDFENWAASPDRNSTGISVVFNGANGRVLNNKIVNGGLSYGIEAGNPGLLVDSNMVTGFPIGIGVSGIGMKISSNVLSMQIDTAIQLTNAAQDINTQVLTNTITNPKKIGIATVQGDHHGTLIKGNIINRQSGAFADDAGSTFRGIDISGGFTAPITIQGNKITQTANSPTSSFTFWGIVISGLYPGSLLDGNQVVSSSSAPFGVGLNVWSPGLLSGSTVENSIFANLAAVTGGNTSKAITINNNTACNVNQIDPNIVTSTTTSCAVPGTTPIVIAPVPPPVAPPTTSTPTVAISNPPPNPIYSGTTNLSATAFNSSGAGVSSLQFQIDGANFGNKLTVPPYTATLDTTTLANGAHTLAAMATDASNSTGSSSVIFVVSNATPATPTPVTPGVCPAPATNAFTGCYYTNVSSFFQTLDLVRTDNAINFNWTANSPDPTVPRTSFAVHWAGNFTFLAGSYTFVMTVDDGARLWVDGQLLIDKWFDENATTYTAAITLTPGMHLIKMDYFQSGGPAVAQLAWQKQ